MRVGELINQLIELKKRHGNLKVLAGDPDYGSGLFPVTNVREDDGTIDIYHGEGPYCRACHRGCD